MGESKFLNWQIGDVKITRVAELGGAPFPSTFMFPAATPELVQRHAWLKPHFAHEDGRLFGSIHSFVIESGKRRIIVDTCVGNDKARAVQAWNMLQGPFLEQLAEAGFPPESIDTVLCTHLHVDHVGWNTRLVNGKWLPTFPNARYLFGRREWEHWSSEAAQHRDGDVMGDSVRPIVDAGLAELVDMNHVLTPEVRLEPTPGHTPGHVSVRISSQGEEAVITGDLMHHPLQCAEPRPRQQLRRGCGCRAAHAAGLPRAPFEQAGAGPGHALRAAHRRLGGRCKARVALRDYTAGGCQ